MSYQVEIEQLDSPFVSVYYESGGYNNYWNNGNYGNHIWYTGGRNSPTWSSNLHWTSGYTSGHANNSLLDSSAASFFSGLQLPDALSGLFFGSAYAWKPPCYHRDGINCLTSNLHPYGVVSYHLAFGSKLAGTDPDAASTGVLNFSMGSNTGHAATSYGTDGLHTGQYLKGGSVSYDPYGFHSYARHVSLGNNTLSGMLIA